MPIVKMQGVHIKYLFSRIDWKSTKQTGIGKFNNNPQPLWIDRDGLIYTISTPIKIHDIIIDPLPDSHLLNIERWLLGRGSEDVSARKRAYNSGYYNIVRDEIDRRNLELLPDHSSIDPQSRGFDMLVVEEPQIRQK